MQRLVDDHLALDEMRKAVHLALNNGDINATYSNLDLFWARLAVHIRAEHLRLFPTVVDGLGDHTDTPTQDEALALIEQLRADHEFFMRELARAIELLRNKSAAGAIASEHELNAVRTIILEVEKRLAIHNELEENQIYRWATTILSEREQLELATQIDAELANLPSRFSVSEHEP